MDFINIAQVTKREIVVEHLPRSLYHAFLPQSEIKFRHISQPKSQAKS